MEAILGRLGSVDGPGAPAPTPPEPTAPPRVCFGIVKTNNNPVQSISVLVALCGQSPRKNLDAVTAEREGVTCEKCLEALAAQGVGEMPEAQARALPTESLKSAGVNPVPWSIKYASMIELLDSAKLTERLLELNEERAAIKELLKAARAKEKVRAAENRPRKRRKRAQDKDTSEVDHVQN